jgi:hypothetical protein
MPEIPDSLNNIATPHALHISPQIDATSRSSTYTEDRRLLRCYVGRLMIVRRLLREASAPNCLHSRPCVRSFLSCITGQRRQKRNRSHLCLLSSGLPPTGSASKQPCTAGETELELEDPYHLVQVIPVNYVMQDMTRKCIEAGETELELEDPYHLVQVIPLNYVMQDMKRKCIDFLFVLC